VTIRRAYEEPLPTDGARILVDRLWPRGVSKEKADLTDWYKNVAPSAELREWYGHVPERFDAFAARYAMELQQPMQADALVRLKALADTGPLTLITATKHPEISEAAVLARLLNA